MNDENYRKCKKNANYSKNSFNIRIDKSANE